MIASMEIAMKSLSTQGAKSITSENKDIKNDPTTDF